MSKPIEAFRNALKIPELKRRIIFTVVMIAIYRLGSHVPTPGVDGAALAKSFGDMSGFFGFYDIFSGGAFRYATVFTLGIMPYISASIIMSLLVAVVPALEKLQKQGHEGQKKITEYTRYGTILLCLIQSVGIGAYLQSQGTDIVPNPGFWFIMMCVISFTTGTAFIMWQGEQISEFGIGNGMSLLIFVNIISRMPHALFDIARMFRNSQLNIFQIGMLAILMVGVVAGAIVITTAQRRIPVQYPRQVKGRKVFGGQRNYLPLRVNQAGVIPIIFASSILMIPQMLQNTISVGFIQDFLGTWFRYRGLLYNIVDSTLVIFFCYFYTAITFNPIEIADNLKKYGGVIMGVRPGKATADYLNKVMVRITLVGSIMLVVVNVLPDMVWQFGKVASPNIVSFFGGTTLLILVGVALDTVRQIEQHLIMRHYDGFAPKGRRLRGRRG